MARGEGGGVGGERWAKEAKDPAVRFQMALYHLF